MKLLSELPLRLSYRTGRDNLVTDFYVPCLESSILYRRAAGYFTSTGLAVAANGVANLASREGRMQLVASPYLEPEDVKALQAAKQNPTAILQKIIEKNFKEIENILISDRLTALAWLAATGLLEVKLALRVNAHGDYVNGIYHEKIGIFTDTKGNEVSFSGSSNETAGGLVNNFESIKVFCSWKDSEGRVQEENDNFEALWQNVTPGLEIIDFTNASKELLSRFKRSGETFHPPTPAVVEVSPLWPHQKAALECFLEAKNGVIEMATGTGKTRLATAICEQLISSKKIRTIIVSTDGTDLLNQWYAQLLGLVKRFDTKWAIHRQYDSFKGRDYFVLEPDLSILLVSRQFLATALKALDLGSLQQTILIQDEVHRLGSPGNRTALQGRSAAIPYRLGLSATPDREYDEEGNNFIKTEIGDVIFTYGLENAIADGILAPFEYYPLQYTPNEEDASRLHAVHIRKAARMHAGNPMSQEQFWTELARVYKISRAKLIPFQHFITQHPDLLRRCIVFVETKEYGGEVLDIIHAHHHQFHTYFAEEDADTLQRFARCEIECLVTCHRLSEGIDIQSLSSVVLFSSSRARLETIQRIGRCLRIDFNNPSKIAHIIDFVRVDSDQNPDHDRAEWLRKLSEIRPTQVRN